MPATWKQSQNILVAAESLEYSKHAVFPKVESEKAVKRYFASKNFNYRMNKRVIESISKPEQFFVLECEKTKTKQEHLAKLFSCIDHSINIDNERPTFEDILRFSRRVWKISEKDVFNKIVKKFSFNFCSYPDVKRLDALLDRKYDFLYLEK